METFNELITNTKTLFQIHDISCKNNGEFIDPLTVIINLALLKYKPIGTKINICGNTLYLDENTMYQGIVRFIGGNTKNDLKKLHIPLIYACKHYLKEDTKDNVVLLFQCAVDGLNNLKQTYKSYDEICVSLTILENIIHKSVTNYIESIEFLETLLELSQTKLDNDIKIMRVLNMRNDMYVQINNTWSNERIILVNTLFHELSKKKDSYRSNLFKSLNSILSDCDNEINILLKTFSKTN